MGNTRLFRCSIRGCTVNSTDEDQILIHAATDWHCPKCGLSDGTEITMAADAEIRYCGTCFEFLNVGEQNAPPSVEEN
jgi:hypothetical protein